MEKTTGVHAVLSLPWAYNSFLRLLGGDQARRKVVEKFIRPRYGDAVLDIGCGTGEWYPLLGPVDYQGYDASAAYIAGAKARFPSGKFFLGTVDGTTFPPGPRFDLVISIGVLHHLGESDCARVFGTALATLRPGGRLITLDPCYDARQGSLARWVIRRDRGKNVRDEQGYLALANIGFSSVKATIWLNPLRIPYTYCILECTK